MFAAWLASGKTKVFRIYHISEKFFFFWFFEIGFLCVALAGLELTL
jgi:hypothetical protein